jgi:hypothetical protein
MSYWIIEKKGNVHTKSLKTAKQIKAGAGKDFIIVKSVK